MARTSAKREIEVLCRVRWHRREPGLPRHEGILSQASTRPGVPEADRSSRPLARGTVGVMATQDPGSTTIKPLTPETWDLFAALVERHKGIFGGCWCVAFHAERDDHVPGYDGNRAFKKCLVEEGIAHAALVVRDGEDDEEAIAWAEYGTPAELPDIHHSKQYLAEQALEPDYRITCIFVDERFRQNGLVTVALEGALADRAGGRRRRRGLSPHPGRAAAVLVVPLQRHEGRLRARRLRLHPAKGLKNTVMRRSVAPSR